MAKVGNRGVPFCFFSLLQIETWEKNLLSLSKASGENLFRGSKRSTNRDFSIKVMSSDTIPQLEQSALKRRQSGDGGGPSKKVAWDGVKEEPL